MIACFHGHSDIVTCLLQQANLAVGACNYFGYTALHMAIATNNIRVAEQLLSTNIDLAFRGGKTSVSAPTYLMLACLRGSVGMFRLILEHTKAQVNAQCFANGWTPLMYAVTRKDKVTSLKICKALLACGADTAVKSRTGKSVIDLARDCQNDLFLDLMMVETEDSADTLQDSHDSVMSDNQKYSIFNAIYSQNSPFLLSIVRSYKNCLEIVHPETGHTPLTLAASRGDRTSMKLLLDHGANVDQPNALNDWTPLMYAVYLNRLDLAKILLDKGANEGAIGKFNEHASPDFVTISVREMAALNNRTDLVQMIDYYKEKRREDAKSSDSSGNNGLKNYFKLLKKSLKKTFQKENTEPSEKMAKSASASSLQSALPRQNLFFVKSKTEPVAANPFQKLEQKAFQRTRQFSIPVFEGEKATEVTATHENATIKRRSSTILAGVPPDDLDDSFGSKYSMKKQDTFPHENPCIERYTSISPFSNNDTIPVMAPLVDKSCSGSMLDYKGRLSAYSMSSSAGPARVTRAVSIPNDLISFLHFAFGPNKEAASNCYRLLKDVNLDDIINLKKEADFTKYGFKQGDETRQLFLAAVKVRCEKMKRELK